MTKISWTIQNIYLHDILGGRSNSVSDFDGLNYQLISQQIIFELILVKREQQIAWIMHTQQETNYLQIATFCDGILRKC